MLFYVLLLFTAYFRLLSAYARVVAHTSTRSDTLLLLGCAVRRCSSST